MINIEIEIIDDEKSCTELQNFIKRKNLIKYVMSLSPKKGYCYIEGYDGFELYNF